MASLGDRLETALELLAQHGSSGIFADIGSDHAFLSIEAIKRSIANKAIAADINELPLLKGRQNANAQGVDVEFILSDGFDAFDGADLSSAAICGMGGELIAKIVLRSKSARNAFLVLQPMSAQEELRKALWDNGFEIICERFVFESGKAYTVMAVKSSGTKTDYSFVDLFLGKERIPSFEFSKYCEKILHSAEKRRLGLIARKESTKDIDELISACQTQTTSFSSGTYSSK